MQTRRTRAAPMSPEQRREAIIAATVPLVRAHGLDVSTRQIAEAAGIAEGTIFRVFDDKESLLRQAVEAAVDPSDTRRRIEVIGFDLPVEQRLLIVAEIMRDRLISVFQLMVAIGMARPPGDDGCKDPHRSRHAALQAAVEALVEPDRDRFRYSPAEVARRLRLLCLAGFHPLLTDNRPLSAEEVVDLLLDGVRARPLNNDPQLTRPEF